MDRHRAVLEIYDVSGMFRQAAASFKASLPLFVTLALLSSVYETAVERSALLSGLSLPGQNSNFSFQFALDSKTQASHSPPNTSLKKFDVADSWLSHFLTALLPPEDQAPHPMDVKQEELADSVEELQHIQLQSNAQDSQSPENVEHRPGSSLTHMASNPDEDKKNLRMVDNVEEAQQRTDTIDEIKASYGETIMKFNQIGESLNIEEFEKTEGNTDAIFPQSNIKSSSEDPERMDTIDETKVLYKELDQRGGSLQHDDVHLNVEDSEKVEKNDDEEATFPRLKIETTSNDTRKVMQESTIDAIDLAFFTGKLLGGRGLDQGAFPHGGFTILVIFLLLAVAVTVILAVVAFQHAAILGSVAFSVISTHMGKRVSAGQAMKSSLKWSIGRLMWLAIMLAALSGLQSFFLMKTFFGAVMEMEQVESLVLRLSATPFAILAPFNDADATTIGMAVRIGLFVSCDYLFDAVAYSIYMVACWVTILERNFWGLGAVMRSCNLVKGMERQALVIRVIEAMICGRTSRWLLQHVIGQFAAAFVICIAQMYFLVLWLIFYMSARSLHDRPSHFSHRTLEDFLDRFR